MLLKIFKYFKTTRFKTTLWYSLIFLVLEIVIGLVIYGYLKHNLYNELDISLTKQADEIYHFVSESEVNLEEFQADSIYKSPDDFIYDLIFEVVAFNPNNTFVQVSYKNQTVFSTANLKENILRKPESVMLPSGLYTFSDSTLSDHLIRASYLQKEDFKIIVAFPIKVISKTLENLTDIYIIIAPIFFVLSLLGGSIISFRALNRIDKIIRETNTITAKNMNRIIEGGEYNDEYGRLVTTMNNMITRIKTSIEYMNQFSISASHELKTPLTILRGEIELALKSPKPVEQYRETLQSNYEETLRLINIVEHLFYLSKIDNALVTLNKQNIQLKSFIEDILKGFSNIFLEKNIRTVIKFNVNQDIEVNADPELFKQIVINLVDNVHKYGKEQTEFLICCNSNSKAKVELEFTNQTEFVNPEALPKIFDRFYRTEESRNRGLGGVGLGLSIVKSLVELHNWKISVSTNDKNLITFKLSI